METISDNKSEQGGTRRRMKRAKRNTAGIHRGRLNERTTEERPISENVIEEPGSRNEEILGQVIDAVSNTIMERMGTLMEHFQASQNQFNVRLSNLENSLNLIAREVGHDQPDVVPESRSREIGREFRTIVDRTERNECRPGTSSENVMPGERMDVCREIGSTENRTSEWRRETTDNLNLLYNDVLMKNLKFDGKGSWNDFKIQFLAIARTRGWEERTKTAVLLSSLSGIALSVLGTMSENDRTNFDKICNSLERRFGERHLENLAYTKFQIYKQKRDEDLSTMASELERLATMSFPDCTKETRDRLLCTKFIDALRNDKLKSDLRILNTNAFDILVNKAMEITVSQELSEKRVTEAELYLRRGFKRPYEGNRSGKDNGWTERRSNGEFRRNNFGEGRTCWQCGKFGHLARECYDKIKRKRYNEKGNGKRTA